MSNAKKILSQQQYLNPLLAGLLLGLVLLMTFAITGHGLGATGFTTRLAAWIGMHVAPVVTNANDYLGGMVEEGKPLNAWITWQVLGVAIGALLSAFLAKRIHFQLDGKKFLGGSKRPMTALFGGILAGFGARSCRLHQWSWFIWCSSFEFGWIYLLGNILRCRFVS